MGTIPPWIQERRAQMGGMGIPPAQTAPAPAPAPAEEEAAAPEGAGGPSDPNYGLYANTETREGLTQKQSYVQQKTGIPSERFDPAWWARGKQEDGTWRPPDKIIWDSWTPAQRAAAGVPDWTSFEKYGKMYAQGHKPGGRFYEQEQQVKRDAAIMLGQNPGMPLDQILNRLGIYNRPEEGRPLFNKIMMEAQGMGTQGRHFDPTTGMAYNTATSDLTKRGIGTPMTAQDWDFYNGMQGARKNPWNNYMANLAKNVSGHGMAAVAKWNRSGNTSTPNIPGTNYYANEFGVTDVYGNPINLGTGQIQSNLGYASHPAAINPYNPNYQGGAQQGMGMPQQGFSPSGGAWGAQPQTQESFQSQGYNPQTQAQYQPGSQTERGQGAIGGLLPQQEESAISSPTSPLAPRRPQADRYKKAWNAGIGSPTSIG